MSTLPWSRPLTVDDLETMPDDGHRYELLDGSLIVTPAPGTHHQRMVLELAVLLRASCPRPLQVFVAPLEVQLARDTVLQPDVLVVDSSTVGARRVTGAPVLAAEVLSPSTRRIDAMLKRSRYEAAGCPSYWLLDPLEPSLLALRLVDGTYVEEASVRGDETWAATMPCPVTVQPSWLVAAP